jgi:hypothetical protein
LFGLVDGLGGEHDQWRLVVELRIGRPEKGRSDGRGVDGLDSSHDPKQHGESAHDIVLAGLGLPLDPIANRAAVVYRTPIAAIK